MASIHHSYDIDLAVEYGPDCAAVIHHFQYWISLNKRRKKNQRDGRTWTFQTLQEIADHFPYWTLEEVRTICDKLTLGKNRRSKFDQGFSPVLMKGNFNRTRFDKTVWYAFIDEDRFINSKNVYERANAQMDAGKCPNPDGPIPTPIPDNRTDNLKDLHPLTPSSAVVPDPLLEWKKKKIFLGFKEEDIEEAVQKVANMPQNSIECVERYLDKVVDSIALKKRLSAIPPSKEEQTMKVHKSAHAVLDYEERKEQEKERIEKHRKEVAAWHGKIFQGIEIDLGPHTVYFRKDGHVVDEIPLYAYESDWEEKTGWVTKEFIFQ